MKISILLLVFPFIAQAQPPVDDNVKLSPKDSVIYSYDPSIAGSDSVVYLYPELAAHFASGVKELLAYLKDINNYPEAMQKVTKKGKVYVDFIVNKNGQISNVKILRGLDPSIDKMVAEMLETMPPWIHATVKDRNVRSMFRLPVPINW